MPIQLPDQVSALISTLAALQEPPISIWLIGSRANGRATELSDTDLIVFGSLELLSIAKSQIKQPEAVDCLIVFNNNEYQDPWQKKNGSLSSLQWQNIDSKTATYIGTKWVPDAESSSECGADMGNLVKRQEQAVRVWP